MGIYRSVKVFLWLLPCIASMKCFCYPLQHCSSQWVDYNKVYPNWKISPTMARFFTFHWERTPCQSPFLVVQNRFS